ncbi:energy transducer TonB [Sphingopyxis sp. MWB1]|uniref:energy transducer TonB n=1 Tax=Sphingopyxis sp. MWB1 TaxID=1537715 RepID=UPI000AFE8AE9|nr:energy transducer TonB [Sphingopyxis sp. MWB1]
MLAVVGGVGFMLARGLDFAVVRKAGETITAIAIPAPPPPEPPPPPQQPDDAASGAASAPNKRADPAPVLAAPSKLPPVTPPVAAAPTPGSGDESSAGAAPDPGPGTGAGGQGDGRGAGGAGSGTGGGTRPAWRSGTIRDSDYPPLASRAKVGGDVEVRFTVQPDGRVTGCRVSRSSGDTAIDATTCRLIEQRFRFRPATNNRGEAIASPYGWRQSWWLERRR